MAAMTPAQQRYYQKNAERLNAKRRALYRERIEQERAAAVERYRSNPEAAEKARLRRQANPEAYRALQRAWFNKNPTKARALINARKAKRRAAAAKAAPPWLTSAHHAEINGVYHFASVMSRITGTQYHVDHIVPLQGKGVCGLHAPWNLRAIPGRENQRKYNKLEGA